MAYIFAGLVISEPILRRRSSPHDGDLGHGRKESPSFRKRTERGTASSNRMVNTSGGDFREEEVRELLILTANIGSKDVETRFAAALEDGRVWDSWGGRLLAYFDNTVTSPREIYGRHWINSPFPEPT